MSCAIRHSAFHAEWIYIISDIIWRHLQGDEDFDDANLLVPKDFGDTLAHIKLAENTYEPSKWKEARVDGIKKTSGPASASFDVNFFKIKVASLPVLMM